MSLSLLPYDLLAPILEYLEGTRPPALRACCLVNHDFNAVAARLLYRHITIYHWYKNPKHKVAALFRTLEDSPKLASFIQGLELTDFPKGISIEVTTAQSSVIPALRNCRNLRSLRWTRDGTLSNEILETLQAPDRTPLGVLEINAKSGGFYNAELLLGFTELNKLVLILPDSETVERLGRWSEKIGGKLRELSIIRKSGALITDAVLQRMGEHLVNLAHLSVLGCSYVTHESILFMLRASISGMQSLYLGAVSAQFDWLKFKTAVIEERLFKRLSSLTLSKPSGLNGWIHLNLSALVESSPVEELNLYDDGASTESSLQFASVEFHLRTIMKMHGVNLRVLSLLRMNVFSDLLEDICAGFPNLRKLFFSWVVAHDPWPVVSLAPLCKLKNLEFFHVNSIRLQGYSEVGFPSQEAVVKLIEQCSPSLIQCGFDTRVWKINRSFELVDDEWRRSISLGPYDRVEVPEQFLVVRT